MPRRRTHVNRIVDSSDDSDYGEPSGTQPQVVSRNSRVTSTQPNNISDGRQKELMTDMVKYILNCSSTKIPIKRADLVKNVLNGKSNKFDTIFQDASRQLQQVLISGFFEIEILIH